MVSPLGWRKDLTGPPGRALLLTLLVAALTAWLAPKCPFPQPAEYHLFSDDRRLLGIANCLNVLSNAPFALVGAMALARVWPDMRKARSLAAFLDELPAFAFALGVTLTAVGSSIYHSDPDDAGLVLDRIPMTFAFMGLSALVVDRYFAPGTRGLLVLPLLAIGVGSVLFWYPGDGGIAPYVLVQALPLMIVSVVLLLSWPKDAEQRGLEVGLLSYGLAKLLESLDGCVYTLSHDVVSGHSLKHLAAAAACVAVIPVLRAPLPDPNRPTPLSDPGAAPPPPP